MLILLDGGIWWEQVGNGFCGFVISRSSVQSRPPAPRKTQSVQEDERRLPLGGFGCIPPESDFTTILTSTTSASFLHHHRSRAGYVRGVHESGRIFGLLPPASVAVSTGIGNGRGIAVNSVRDFVKVIMVTVGCPRIVLKTEPDPLTIPTPVFRLPRFGLRDHLIYRAEQIFIFRWIQSPSLVPAKAGSAGVYRKMRVESSGGSPMRHGSNNYILKIPPVSAVKFQRVRQRIGSRCRGCRFVMPWRKRLGCWNYLDSGGVN